MPALEVYFTLHHNMFVYSTSLLILVTVQRAQKDKRMVGVVYAASYLFDFSLTKKGKEILITQIALGGQTQGSDQSQNQSADIQWISASTFT